MENSDCDQETWHVRFRTFSSSEESDPVEDLRRLRELCHLWLRPDLHTKEQMMDRLVLEQFMICMPLECQVLLKESGVQSCKALEDVLRNKQKPKNWVSRTLMMGVGQGDTCKLQGSQDRTCGSLALYQWFPNRLEKFTVGQFGRYFWLSHSKDVDLLHQTGASIVNAIGCLKATF